MKLFKSATPESCGIKSEDILRLIKSLDSYKMSTHSIIMAKGNSIVAEGYYAPFTKDFQHRMYSVSKSFVAIAVGLAYTEGLLSLDDTIMSYLPEYSEGKDEYFQSVTIRNMLSMQSNVNRFSPWWGVYSDRTEAYYTNTTGQLPGTLYAYDSMGSALLGVIVERLTGKTFLDYLKDAFLLEMGFSEESYTLYEPGGHTVGDSGVVCTARDLLIFARFILNKGVLNGRQIIDRTFMDEAVKVQSDNNLSPDITAFNTSGYCYLIWKTHESGFSLIGMGDQIAICDEEKDFIFIINSDNQGSTSSRHIIFHEVLKNLIPAIADAPYPENTEAFNELTEYLNSRKLFTVEGENFSETSEKISGVTYVLSENTLKMEDFTLTLNDAEGTFSFTKDRRKYTIPFGFTENIKADFSLGMRTHKTCMGKNEEGVFSAVASGAWTEKDKFSIKMQIIDNYFGQVVIHLYFKDDEVSLVIRKSGQYVLDGFSGYAMGRKKEA